MVKMIALKCPECGAKLQIEDGRKECFCQYCGHKILLDDGSVETTYTYRKVDEARIKEAEVDKLIRLKELEIKQKELDSDNELNNFKIKITIGLAITIFISMIFHLNLELWVIIFTIIVWKAGNNKTKINALFNGKKEDSK